MKSRNMTLTGEAARPETNNLLLKIKYLEDLNYMMAHNLRGAASSIKMFSDYLLENETEVAPVDNTNNTELHDALSCINASSDKLLTTLTYMMDDVEKKLEQSTFATQCDIREIAENVTAQLGGVVYEKKARISYSLAVKHVNYAKVYLESYLYNFISNSLKYSRPDAAPEIGIYTHKQNEKTILEITDNGLGIDLEKHGNKLFGLKQTFHEGYDSKGIGLYMTKCQVEYFGGSIKVESKVNSGTRFILTL